MNPDIGRGVLGFLAATQASETNVARDCEPGKILHEARRGEMAALREIPFGRYYGSVDSTPLFVVLAGAYFRRTGDIGSFNRSGGTVVPARGGWVVSATADQAGFMEA